MPVTESIRKIESCIKPEWPGKMQSVIAIIKKIEEAEKELNQFGVQIAEIKFNWGDLLNPIATRTP